MHDNVSFSLKFTEFPNLSKVINKINLVSPKRELGDENQSSNVNAMFVNGNKNPACLDEKNQEKNKPRVINENSETSEMDSEESKDSIVSIENLK